MKIQQVCQQTGLTQRTVRFYVEEGLLAPAAQERRGRVYREYTEEDVRALRQISALRRAGLTVQEIGALQRDPAQLPNTLTACLARLQEEDAARTVQKKLLARALDTSPKTWQQLAAALTTPAVPGADPAMGLFDDESAAQKQAAADAFWQKQKQADARAARVLPWVRRAAVLALAAVAVAGAVYFRPRPLAALPGWQAVQTASVIRMESGVWNGEPVLESTRYELTAPQLGRVLSAARQCWVVPAFSSLWGGSGPLGVGPAGRTYLLTADNGDTLLLTGAGRLEAAGRQWLSFTGSDARVVMELDAALDKAQPLL